MLASPKPRKATKKFWRVQQPQPTGKSSPTFTPGAGKIITRRNPKPTLPWLILSRSIRKTGRKFPECFGRRAWGNVKKESASITLITCLINASTACCRLSILTDCATNLTKQSKPRRRPNNRAQWHKATQRNKRRSLSRFQPRQPTFIQFRPDWSAKLPNLFTPQPPALLPKSPWPGRLVFWLELWAGRTTYRELALINTSCF